MTTIHIIETSMSLTLDIKIFKSIKSTVYKSVIDEMNVAIKLTTGLSCNNLRTTVDVISRLNTYSHSPRVYFLVCPVDTLVDFKDGLDIYHSNDLVSTQVICVSEYIEGLDWETMCPQTAIRYFPELIINLQRLHSLNIYHRDIKPQNIIFHADGKADFIDFDMSVILTTGIIKTIAYTHNYAAPETLKRIDRTAMSLAKTDVYSLGMTFLVLLCKKTISDIGDLKTPHEVRFCIKNNLNDTIAELCDELPTYCKSLIPMIKRMCATDPNTRPPLEELHQELQTELHIHRLKGWTNRTKHCIAF